MAKDITLLTALKRCFATKSYASDFNTALPRCCAAADMCLLLLSDQLKALSQKEQPPSLTCKSIALRIPEYLYQSIARTIGTP